MRELVRVLTLLAIVAGGLVLGRYAWAKYIAGKKDVSLEQAATQTKQDVVSKVDELNQNLGNVLGESSTKEQLSQGASQYIQQQVQQSEIVKQVQTEVTKIVEQTTQNVQQLPQEEINKIQRNVKEEICKSLLKD
jgi:sugar-specific transcriptional regulator TrmB